ncbi:MAG: hypothetical protein H0U49_08240, partial [Parachlamydiaceae bacterium]|nr:hypothetical protein [Parachlamydiaceae bacterium]
MLCPGINKSALMPTLIEPLQIKTILKGALIDSAVMASAVGLSVLAAFAVATVVIYPIGLVIAASTTIGITVGISCVAYRRLCMKTLNTKEFNECLDSAKYIATKIGDLEKNKQLRILDNKLKFYHELCAYSKSELGYLHTLKSKMQYESLNLKKEFDVAQKDLFDKLESDLVRLTEIHNKAVEDRMLAEGKDNPSKINAMKAYEKNMQSRIIECNSLISQMGLPTNEFTTTKSHVHNFVAVVDKKLCLLERKLKHQQNPIAGSKKLEKIEKILGNAPSFEAMQQSSKAIKESLTKPAVKIVDHHEAKALNLAHPELKWGESHMNHALTLPANWTEVRSSMIKLSSAGKMYVSVTLNTPLNIGKEGGVPSGMRSHKAFKHRATNLMMTTSYLKDSKGRYDERVTFRGGQFPTKMAAKEALMQMIQNLPKGQKLEKLHINSLLTPTAFTAFIRDKALIAAHRENILGAINELMLDPKSDRESLQKLKNEIAISNLGVNEGAVGELKYKFLRFPYKFGWHTSIGMYSNEASQKMNQALNTWMDGIDKENPSISNLDRLGAILEVGQEMEAVWANNDYANPKVGNNQFKMPALWKTMDGLIDVVSYTNCMSGKDRTGEVESSAQGYIDEINMNIADQKCKLIKTFDDTYNSLNIFQKLSWSK